MDSISYKIGKKIKFYRKCKGFRLDDLALKLHKSKSTISKYESGDIVLDVITMYNISKILGIRPEELLDIDDEDEINANINTNNSPFFEARRLYFYFYDGRYNRLKGGIIDIKENLEKKGEYDASLYISSSNKWGRGSNIYYKGRVVYSDMLIRFSFVNQINRLEEDLLYIFNPLEIREATDGLLSGISSYDFLPCAFRCLVTLNPQREDEELKKRLLFTKEEIDRWYRLNMVTVDNKREYL